jgi:hypothetical protein
MSFINDDLKEKILGRLNDPNCKSSFHRLIQLFWPKIYKEYENSTNQDDNSSSITV